MLDLDSAIVKVEGKEKNLISQDDRLAAGTTVISTEPPKGPLHLDLDAGSLRPLNTGNQGCFQRWQGKVWAAPALCCNREGRPQKPDGPHGNSHQLA